MSFEFIKIRTRVVRPPKDEIWDILRGLEIQNGDIIFITSKILGIHEGRTVHKSNADKYELIRKESSRMLPYENRGGFFVNLTVAQNILIPNAGIDESNADDHYILWPRDADKLCKDMRKYLIAQNKGVHDLGVVSTDSHTTPLRWGVTGIVTGIAGVQPLKNLRGHRDIFGREIKVTQVNIADALAGMAVLMMGEGAEQIPIVILRGYKDVEFSADADMRNFKIEPELDLYSPLIDCMPKTSK